MKRVDGFQCENCGEIHNTAQGAMDCESAHADRLKNAKISGRFSDKSRVYGIARFVAHRFPKTIHVQFSDFPGDFASYEFVSSGPKGM